MAVVVIFPVVAIITYQIQIHLSLWQRYDFLSETFPTVNPSFLCRTNHVA